MKQRTPVKVPKQPDDVPPDVEIREALLAAYRKFGRIRMPLPALISFAMRYLGGDLNDHLVWFPFIHSYIRRNWGNHGLFSRRRGVKGGIKVRDTVPL